MAPFKPTHKRHTTLSRPGKECLHKKKQKALIISAVKKRKMKVARLTLHDLWLEQP